MVGKARLDLGFTKILSPIAGIAGIARAQIGNLVGGSSQYIGRLVGKSLKQLRVCLEANPGARVSDDAGGG